MKTFTEKSFSILWIHIKLFKDRTEKITAFLYRSYPYVILLCNGSSTNENFGKFVDFDHDRHVLYSYDQSHKKKSAELTKAKTHWKIPFPHMSGSVWTKFWNWAVWCFYSDLHLFLKRHTNFWWKKLMMVPVELYCYLLHFNRIITFHSHQRSNDVEVNT